MKRPQKNNHFFQFFEREREMAAISLSSGYSMPVLGLGVWRMEKKSIRDLIINAINIGYRHFDCAVKPLLDSKWPHDLSKPAAHYKNEVEVGEALAEAIHSGLVKREELFITTKLWNSDHGHVIEACQDSLKKLQLDYLDLYLIHFPVSSRHTGVGATASARDKDGVLDVDTNISLESTWHAMEDLVSMGLVRSIGISNYDIFLTRDCLAYSKVKPAVNQIETHPYFQRDSLVKFCQKHGICVTAHTPLGGATANVELFGSISCLDDPILKDLAKKYNKTLAQIVLRWGIQRNTVVIPKTCKIDRLKENFQVFNFQISKEDMDLIKSVDRKHRTNQPSLTWGMDPYT
ncbi:NADP-dependent D-sorbitol-6-phosphate dehydrogenase-like protein [Cinnamomum micranthum f. kanehirae]|uniref:NADP-dependent D-sorbitol-6-phosphate dehydrogenase-like protein n=1 Tax=Cinnamomum micranthum f. kanehirae TaxID=337451 RepID=A0A3S3P372_9MAGN|nr:NADP-dependent D-sorbitol-6-phosphate dehydrogenase-like protein [Cinnamomum micranthum f. kanehirae]